MKTLHDYQEDAVNRILSEPTKAALIGSEVGLGKTLLATEVALRAGWRRVLLIGIVHTFDQWDEHFREQSAGVVGLRKMDSTKAGRAVYADFLAGEPGYYFAGIQWLYAQDWEHRDKKDSEGAPIPMIDKKTGLPTGKNQRERVHLKTFAKMCARKGGTLDAVVFDEAHQVSERTSVGRKTLLTLKTEWKLALSATWAGNSFENAWSLTNWCWPDLIPAYWTWHTRWCKTETQYIGGGRKVQVTVGEKEPEGEFIKTLPLYIRHLSAERPPEPVKIFVQSTPEQRRQYQDLVDELLTWAKSWDGDREPLVVDIPAVLDARLKQVALAELSFDVNGDVNFASDAPSAKLHALKGILDSWGDQPAIIFTPGSKKFAKLVSDRMNAVGYQNEMWTGDTPAARRPRIKKDFIEGRLRYIVATPESMGTGTDGLQRVCNKMVWLSTPDGNPTVEEQGVGRLFRPHRTMEGGGFVDVRILMEDSVDVDKLETLIAKGRSVRSSIGAH